MLKIDDAYLEDEVRDGFYIPSMTKRTWAMELTVLDLIDSICRKHDITYFADWGTYLGAVRHGGFVPWDDDMDICMHRNEFEKFKKYAEKELPEGYSIMSFYNNNYSWKFIVNVVPNDHMCFTADYLKSHYSFPYIVAVDIFIIDNVSDDQKLEDARNEQIKSLLNEADRLNIEDPTQLVKKRQLFAEVENILKIENNHDTNRVVQKVPWGVYNGKSFPAEYFKEAVRIPFEMIEILVPICFDRGMRIKYGDYMRIIMDGAGHDYPYYIGQKKALGEDFDYPSLYKFNETEINDRKKDFSCSLKVIAKDIADYIREASDIIREIVSTTASGSETPSQDEILGYLADVQKNLVDFGMLVEKLKGEGTETVTLLEKLCELIFELAQGIQDDGNALGDQGNNVVAIVSDISEISLSICDAVNKEIINRKSVLFLPVKAKYWNTLRPIFDKYANSDDTDVYVSVLPYCYKEYDGRLKDELQSDIEAFRNIFSESIEDSNNVRIISYDEVDLSLMCPDEVFTNCPYDNYNMAISIPEYYYAKNIRRYTNKLTYVPFFKSYEFEKTNYPCWYNMQYYCTVPGVVLADEVLAQSENMRQRYIEKLSEWCGEENKQRYLSVWEEKIKVITDIYPEYYSAIEKTESEQPDGTKKKLVFYINVGTLIEKNDEYFEKLYRCISTFKDSRDKLDVLLITDSFTEKVLTDNRPDLLQKWNDFINEFNESDIGTYISKKDDSIEFRKKIVQTADAYYGNPSVLCKDFIMHKKPVMLMDTEI